jgi:hypothetical protein
MILIKNPEKFAPKRVMILPCERENTEKEQRLVACAVDWKTNLGPAVTVSKLGGTKQWQLKRTSGNHESIGDRKENGAVVLFGCGNRRQIPNRVDREKHLTGESGRRAENTQNGVRPASTERERQSQAAGGTGAAEIKNTVAAKTDE